MARVEDHDNKLDSRKEACKTFVEQTKLLVGLASAFVVAPAAVVAVSKLRIDKWIIMAEILFIVSVFSGYIALGAIAGSQHKGEFNVYNDNISGGWEGGSEFFSSSTWALLFYVLARNTRQSITRYNSALIVRHTAKVIKRPESIMFSQTIYRSWPQQVSRASAEEQLVALLNEGYQLRQNLWSDYDGRRKAEVFDAVSDIQRYYGQVDEWGNQVNKTLQEVFPTALESNYFCSRESHPAVSYQGMDQKFGRLFYNTLPSYTERLKRILEADLPRYTDLPIQDRLFIEDIDSFRKVRDINPAMVTGFLKNGFLNKTEDQYPTCSRTVSRRLLP